MDGSRRATEQPNPVLTLSAEPKPRGANRSTKVTGKLKVLPDQPTPGGAGASVPGPASAVEREPISAREVLPPPPRPQQASSAATAAESSEDEGDDEDEDEGEEQEAEVYNQIALIPEGTAKRDAMRLTKRKAKSLPRVTAYATASSYRFHELLKFFRARQSAYHTAPRTIDDVIYTPYAYDSDVGAASSALSSSSSPENSTVLRRPPKKRQSESQPPTGDLLGIGAGGETTADEGRQNGGVARRRRGRFGETPAQAEIFIFKYGTVVIWGMTEQQERRFLSSIKRFEVERLASDDVEMEDLNYYYANYSRIYNDVITLRRGSSYMTKLSLSHALSQSVKISLFEELISSTIEETKDIPDQISESGKILMPHKEIMSKIGELFLLRTNINSVGSVLDSPEVFWSYPDLQPLYDAARSYLEIPQRIHLLNTRVEVLQDMLQLLKDSVSSRHSERLEQIVIVLIGLEIMLGIITILVDLFA